MFDFFRDLYFETKGIDVKKAELERLEKKKKRDEGKIIFSKDVKIVVYFVGAFFLLASFSSIPALFAVKSYGLMIRAIVQDLLVVAVMILLKIHTKKSELIAILLMIIFFILQYSTLILSHF